MTPAERPLVRRLQRLCRFICMAVGSLLAVACALGRSEAQIALPGPGLISTVAGNGTAGYSGDNGAAISAEVHYPSGVAVDGIGNVYIADTWSSRIRMIKASTGIITTVAGNGIAGFSGDGGNATSAQLNYPSGVALDGAGNIYIADTSNFRIRKVTSAGVITTVAGNGQCCYGGDGGSAINALLFPSGVAVDSANNIYIADGSNNRIREITVPTGIITTIAGNGTAGYTGDNGPATSAELRYPDGVVIDSSGNIYIADTGNDRIRKITISTGVISTVAGNGTGGYSGDGGAATSAELAGPTGIGLDSANNIYIVDSDNQVIREVAASTGIISTIAGNGTTGYAGDGGSATGAKLNGPETMAADRWGNIYIADTLNSRIRAVNNTVSLPVPALPTFAPSAGRYMNPQTVTISDTTSGAAIYYTTDGTTPATSSAGYTGPVTVSSSETLSAIAVANTVSSPVTSATYTIGSSPTFSPVAGTYTSARTVAITSTDFGATIYYTTNGTTPTTSSARYTGPINVGSTETVKAIAVLGAANSTVSMATYTINLAPPASAIATITVNGSEQTGDTSVITVSFNGFVESVYYGQYSTRAAIASAFGAKFSNDYLHDGLCAHASGSIITFTLKGGAAFGALDVEGAATSFQLQGSGFATQVAKTVDTGTVTLTVGGVVAAQTNYGDGATPSSIAEGLAGNVTSDSLVNIAAVDDTLNLLAKQSGSATNYSYTLQTTSWDSTDFSQPSFAYPVINGSLIGGVDASSGQGQQTIYSYSIPSFDSGSQPTGYDAVGNIVGYTDSVMGTWSMASGYDQLNRLTSANATAGLYSGVQISWSYDPFGNRKSETFGGTTQMPLPTSSTAAYNDPNHYNRISSTSLGSVQYDASGDVTQDNQNQYLYDGDGKLCAVKNVMFGSIIGYIYGADGTRVSTGTLQSWGTCDPSPVSQGGNGFQPIKDTIMGPSGGQLTEIGVDANGTFAWAHTNVWAGGQLIATYDPNGLHFYLNDWTGSRRIQTDYQGVVERTCTNLPYGNGETCGADPSGPLYAGLDRDSSAGLDNATYRQYASFFGRWTTPDPYAGSYDWANPQSLNRYAYVGGNPLAMTDPSGLDTSCTQFPYYCVVSLANNVVKTLDLYDNWVDWLDSTPVVQAIPVVGELYSIADELYNIFNDGNGGFFSGGPPAFHGNVAASQSGKHIPTMSALTYPTGSVYYNGGDEFSANSYAINPSFDPSEFGSIEPMSRLECADYVGDKELSIASMTSGDSPDNPVVKTFLGNSISGVVEMVRHRNLLDLAIGGWNPGIPGVPSPKIRGLAIDGGLSGMVTKGILGGAEDVFALPKLAYDAATWTGALLFECQGSPW